MNPTPAEVRAAPKRPRDDPVYWPDVAVLCLALGSLIGWLAGW